MQPDPKSLPLPKSTVLSSRNILPEVPRTDELHRLGSPVPRIFINMKLLAPLKVLWSMTPKNFAGVDASPKKSAIELVAQLLNVL